MSKTRSWVVLAYLRYLGSFAKEMISNLVKKVNGHKKTHYKSSELLIGWEGGSRTHDAGTKNQSLNLLATSQRLA